MTDDGWQHRYHTRLRESPEAPATPEVEVEDTGEAHHGRSFGYVLGQRQAVMLELRTLQGDALALNYAYLVSIAFNPSGELTLAFTTHKVTITGTNLLPLFRQMTLHRTTYVQQLDPLQATTLPPQETEVTAITIDSAL